MGRIGTPEAKKYGMFDIIQGVERIALHIGYSMPHTQSYLIHEMADLNLAFKTKGKTAPWRTTPYFCALYLFIRSKRRHEQSY